jgi:uncharacterized protein YjbI with pentapeptide repeats
MTRASGNRQAVWSSALGISSHLHNPHYGTTLPVVGARGSSGATASGGSTPLSDSQAAREYGFSDVGPRSVAEAHLGTIALAVGVIAAAVPIVALSWLAAGDSGDSHNSAYIGVVSALGATVGIMSIFQANYTRRQLRRARSRLKDAEGQGSSGSQLEVYARSVSELLRGETSEIRIAAIHSLGRVGTQTPDDAISVCDVLTSYVRRRSVIPAGEQDHDRVAERSSEFAAALSVLVTLTTRYGHLLKVDLRGAQLQGLDFRSADFTGANLLGADLRFSTFTNVKLDGANLRRARLDGALLVNASLASAILEEASLDRIVAPLSDFAGALLSHATMRDAFLAEASFHGTFFGNSDLTGSVLTNADLTKAFLGETKLDRANLRGAKFDGARAARSSWDHALRDEDTTLDKLVTSQDMPSAGGIVR